MMLLKKSFGLTEVFGLLTSNQEWKFCWLGEETKGRTFYGTKTLQFNDKNLINYIGTFFIKIQNSKLKIENHHMVPYVTNKN